MCVGYNAHFFIAFSQNFLI